MRRTDAIVIGGGQAGLAMSRCLAGRGIDHVVLERGRIAERWRSERWDSLRLLTPNWHCRLPGQGYRGPDPDGYMRAPAVVDMLVDYARSFAAPVEQETTVLSLSRGPLGYRVRTDQGDFAAPTAVIASGYCDIPHVPAIASALPRDIHQIAPARYKNPGDLPEGGVLVVGASASGVQLAEELQRSGRPVTLAVGRHIRLPRSYRGLDIIFWLDRMGLLDEGIDEVRNPDASRAQPSLQLVGRDDRQTLDLAALRELGVNLVGRVVGIEGTSVRFADDLPATTHAADVKLSRMLDRVDAFAQRAGFSRVTAGQRPASFVAAPAEQRIDLRARGIRSVVWATGFRRSYPWLDVPVLDREGELVHDRGVTPAAGLYVLGLRFMRRRKSSFIGGVGDDARDLVAHVAQHLDARAACAA